MSNKSIVDEYFEKFKNKFDSYNCDEKPIDSCINNRYVISFGEPPKDKAIADEYSKRCRNYARNIVCE